MQNYNKDVTFKESWFHGEADFWEVQFCERAYIRGSFEGDVNFRGAKFNSSAYIGGIFEEDAYFSESQFSGDAYFIGSRFDGDAYFIGSRFCGNAYFLGEQFSEDVYIRGSVSSDILLEDTVFSKALFLSRSRFNKFYLKWSNIKTRLIHDDEIYLSLIVNYKNLGWLEDADECYYSYRKQHEVNGLIRRFFDLAARFSYGYGVKPELPLIWSAFIILLFGLILYSCGFMYPQTNQTISLGDNIFFSTIAFTSGVSPLLNATSGLSLFVGSVAYLIALERFLGWVFFVLFLAAIAKTIIR